MIVEDEHLIDFNTLIDNVQSSPLTVTPVTLTQYSYSDSFFAPKRIVFTNKVHHNGSADQASDYTIKDFQDGKDDAAAAVIQKSWRRHTERKMKNELTSKGVPEKKEDKKRQGALISKNLAICGLGSVHSKLDGKTRELKLSALKD